MNKKKRLIYVLGSLRNHNGDATLSKKSLKKRQTIYMIDFPLIARMHVAELGYRGDE